MQRLPIRILLLERASGRGEKEVLLFEGRRHHVKVERGVLRLCVFSERRLGAIKHAYALLTIVCPISSYITKDWKRHKKACKAAKADQERADSYSLHKAEFDRIRLKYGFDKKADEISDLLTMQGNEGGVSVNDFAERFGTTPEEAMVFLEWIKVGVKFKEETLDVAKKAGFSGPSVAGKR